MPKRKSRTVEVAWICDGKVEDCRKSGCYYGEPRNGIRGPCMHTQNPRHAKYGARDPKKYPDRFDKFEYGDDIRYYEKYEEERNEPQ